MKIKAFIVSACKTLLTLAVLLAWLLFALIAMEPFRSSDATSVNFLVFGAFVLTTFGLIALPFIPLGVYLAVQTDHESSEPC